jgi:hypothetical protein
MLDSQSQRDVLDLYLGYDRLTASALGRLLSGLGEMSLSAVQSYSDISGIVVTAPPALEVDTIRTGESVKFAFGEGWLPSIGSDAQNDVVIGVPKKLGIPFLIAYLLLNAASLSMGVQKDYLDIRIKEIELKLKTMEIQRVIQPDSSYRAALDDQAKDLLDSISHNPDYRVLKVNGVDISPILRRDSNADSRHRE